MDRWAAWMAGRNGRQRAVLAVVLGAATALVMPPFHLLPLLWVSFPGLLWLLDGATTRRGAFAVGWFFGLGQFAAGLHWVAHSFLTDPERFAWMIPFAIGGLAAGLALFTGLTTLALRATGTRGWSRVVAFAALWMLFEWVRGWALTGFPWNLMGTAWTVVPAMLQPASVIGVYGLGLITVALAALPATLAAPRGRPGRRRPMAVGIALLALVGGWGTLRLSAAGPPDASAIESVRLRLVQPNIPQVEKWHPGLKVRNVGDQVALSRMRSADAEGTPLPPPTHVIWAETAVPFYLAETPDLLRLLGDTAPEDGLLLAGARRRLVEGGRVARLWNSLQAIDGDGRIIATYDKVHLVPFGEYVPFKEWLRIAKLTTGSVDFSPGDGRPTLRLPGLPPVAPLICYEAIFPGAVADPDDRPEWLLNITNDGWFGLSPGPYQHFAAVRLRAVEEGLPLVRVANTGISGVVDPFGRVTAYLELGRRGVLDAALPRPLPAATPFSRLGNALPVCLASVLLVACAGLARARRR